MSSRQTYSLLKTVGVIALLLSSSSAVAKSDSQSRNFEKDSVEAGLWHQSDEFEKKLNMSAARIRDTGLNNYIINLNRKVAGDHFGEIRTSLLKAPVFNAGIFPNGAMFVYSGLMLRVDNEAQLACVLAHENAHYVHKHSLKRAQETSKSVAAHKIVGIATLGYGTLVTAVIAASQVSSFSRENERESDIESIKLISDLGYDPKQCAQIWGHVIDESLASSNKKKKKRATKSPIFASHPSSPDRKEYLLALADVSNSTVTTANDNEAYRRIIRPYLAEWLEAELDNRDYGSMLHLIDRLQAVKGDEGVLNYARGRVYETRNDEGDKALMDAAFLEASKYNDAPAVLWRSMGDMYARTNEADKAITAFEKYLMKQPQAPDKDLIDFMILDLRGTQ